MPIVDGVKMSCEVCLRGHRGAVCAHSDRKLYPVRKKGRPRKAPAPPADQTSSQPSQRSKEACCSGSDCRCIHIEGELIESRGCACCGPGLAQQDLTDAAFVAPNPAYSNGTQSKGCCSAPASSSSLTLPSASPSASSSYVPPALPQASSQSAIASPPAVTSPPAFKLRSPSRDDFAFDLPCTCPDPCPCPGCPSHSLTSDVGSKHKKNKRPARRPGESCCTSVPQFAAKVSQDHCEGCLPCIIAPFEGPSASLDSQSAPAKRMRTGPGGGDTQPAQSDSQDCPTSSNVTLPPLYDGITSQQRRLPPFAVVAAASPGPSTPQSQPSTPGPRDGSGNYHYFRLAGQERHHRSQSQIKLESPSPDDSKSSGAQEGASANNVPGSAPRSRTDMRQLILGDAEAYDSPGGFQGGEHHSRSIAA